MVPFLDSIRQRVFSSSGLIFGINVLVVLILFFSVGKVSGHLLQQEILKLPTPVPKVAIPPKEPLPQDAGMPKTAFNPMLDRNIFDAQRRAVPKPPVKRNMTPVKPPPPRQIVTEAKRVTRPFSETLSIELRGTMVTGKKHSTYSSIAKTRGKIQKLFGVGECFTHQRLEKDRQCGPQSVKVTKIQNRKIALQYLGQEEWLEKKDTSPKPKANSRQSIAKTKPKKKNQKPNRVTSTRNSNEPTKAQKAAAPKKPVNPANGSEPVVMNLQREWVDEQLNNFAEILQDARVVPITKNKKTYFQFKHIKSGSMYETLGLQKGDIIHSVNGRVIDNIQRAMLLLEKLQSEREIVLGIEREEQPMTLKFLIF